MARFESDDPKEMFKVVKHPDIRNILVVGPPGVGKTTWAFLVADLLKLECFKVQYHAEMTPSELFGMYVPVENTFEWMPGPLDMAYTKGGVLVHDEIIEASGPCKTFLYGAFDNGRGGEIDYVGRKFKPIKGGKNIATMNGWPHEGGLSKAFLDRIDATFVMVQPHAKQLETLDPDLREICVDAYDTAKDVMEGPDITFRMLKSFQVLRTILPLEKAVRSAVQGNDTLAKAFLEVLALSGDDDDEGLEDDE